MPSYPDKLVSDAMKNTEKAKGRLLYYFPLSEETLKKGSADSWIGWHNDSGFLTALAGDLYVNDETGEKIENTDTSAGLYVVDREGDSVKVRENVARTKKPTHSSDFTIVAYHSLTLPPIAL